MAYDERLAERVRSALDGQEGLGERKMFGGLAFMAHGNMVCGVEGDRLMVRVGPERYEEALGKPHVTLMDFTGRPMKGFVFVAPAGTSTETALKDWLEMGVQFSRTLPPKAAKGAAR